jgi:hypothetical protein
VELALDNTSFNLPLLIDELTRQQFIASAESVRARTLEKRLESVSRLEGRALLEVVRLTNLAESLQKQSIELRAVAIAPSRSLWNNIGGVACAAMLAGVFAGLALRSEVQISTSVTVIGFLSALGFVGTTLLVANEYLEEWRARIGRFDQGPRKDR